MLNLEKEIPDTEYLYTISSSALLYALTPVELWPVHWNGLCHGHPCHTSYHNLFSWCVDRDLFTPHYQCR